MSTVKIKDVYVINEQDDGKSRWLKCGVAFINKDESINVILDALPVSGKLHIRDRESKAQKAAD